MKRVVLLLFLLIPACLWAFDFSAAFNQELGYGGIDDNTGTDYEGGFIPYFSTAFNDSGDLYISAWIKVVYEYEKTVFTGEFIRTELSWRFHNLKIKSGRIPYAASFDFSAESLFDGTQAFYDTKIDLNDVVTPYNNMYISAKAAMPVKQFLISTGVCIQTAKAGDETGIGLAGELGGSWIAPTPFFSQLSLTGRYSSGKSDGIYPFIPVTAKPQGNVLQAKLPGISALFLDYTAKLLPTVSAGLTTSYFYRSEKETYADYPVNPVDNSGSALGCELFGRAVWAPFTDLSMNMGAGIFLPSTGNANPKADTQWRLELGLTLTVY